MVGFLYGATATGKKDFMTSSQLSYSIASLVLALVLILLLIRARKLDSALIRNTSIVILSVLISVSLFTFFSIDLKYVSLFAVILAIFSMFRPSRHNLQQDK